MELKERFLRVYANLPLRVREEVVCVVKEDQPVSWNVASLEINNDTPKGKEILAILEELKII